MMQTLVQALAAAVGSMAFGMIFGVRPRHLAFAGLCGGLGGLVYLLLNPAAGNLVALLCASLAIGTVSEILARLRRCPATVFLIAGLIPLVPGARIYMTMQLAVTGEAGEAGAMLYTLLLEAGALALGIVLVSSFRALRKRVK